MQVAIPLFPRFTALDGIGPYEVLQRIPDVDITFVGHDRTVIRSENGFLGIQADATFEEVAEPDVIVFPGGVGTRALMEDERVLDWVRSAHETTTFTTSVCTGSLVLGAAGLLDGTDGDDALVSARSTSPASAPYRPTHASSSTSTDGSSPPPVCRPGSTWRCASSRSCSTARPPRPAN